MGSSGRWTDRRWFGVLCGAIATVVSACGGAGSSALAPSGSSSVVPAVLVGAGDIADCPPTGAEATAKLLDGIKGTVVTLGDNAYPDGSARRVRPVLRPHVGTSQGPDVPLARQPRLLTASGAPYFAYFGDRAGPSGVGYYSFDTSNWHGSR